MYLSKVAVDWKMSRNPYNLHQALWSLFPDRPNESRSFLFHVQSNNPGDAATLLMLSRNQPTVKSESSQIVQGPKDLTALKLIADQTYRFVLTANPTKVIKDRDDKSRKVRVPLIREEQQVDWLFRKLHGAALLETAIARTNLPIYFHKPGHGAGKIVTVTFEGVLRVTTPEELFKRMMEGIGPAKGFGCGLLLVRRF
jgi:CRISPR system Cascade subunit CasE